MFCIQKITEDILSSPVPTDVNDILIEASILSVTTIPSSPEEDEQQQIIERF